ncbi:hypothetical protein BXO88_05555 [Oribacterium sp. C9]|nr:hypothetical protein BXO88_05555 [Oribacterium sp. C9]
MAEEAANLTTQQSNAIEMLNYITVLTQDINTSKNSRIYMENAYSTLINNTYPNAVDSRTLSHLTGLLDTMESYRMIDVKRERLQYVYEQSQAQAMKAAIPNPTGLLSTVHSFHPAKLIGSVVYMAMDSAMNYIAYKSETEQKFLKDGWALDDEEAKVLHESRKGTFSYMVKMVNEYNLPGDLTLTEDSVKDLVNWKNNSNIVGRIQFLESNKKTYQAYGGYWLIRAESYYKNDDYKKCLSDVETYEKMGTRIFRRDYEYAKILPLAIASAKETMKKDEYAKYASEKAQVIVNNTDHDDWALRYFAAQTFVDIYAETKDKIYLQDAYNIVVDNVNYLLSEQKTQNEEYLKEVSDKAIPKSATKEEKNQIEEYNKMRKEARKVELAPIYEPLRLNLDLLFAIADELKISASDKKKIDKMLHPNAEAVFLVESVENNYWFDKNGSSTADKDMNVSISKGSMVLPASILTSDSNIKVSVKDGNMTNVFTDWVLKEVERDTENVISTHKAEYTSKTSKDYGWKADETISIDVSYKGSSKGSHHFEFKTKGNKNEWFEYLKVWESDVLFERVK